MSPSVEERKDGNGNEAAASEMSRTERTNRNLEKFLSLNLQSPRQQLQQQQQRLQVSVRPMHRVMLQQQQQQHGAPGNSRRVRLGAIKGNHTYFSCKLPPLIRRS